MNTVLWEVTPYCLVLGRHTRLALCFSEPSVESNKLKADTTGRTPGEA
jgi:hypothetical protein